MSGSHGLLGETRGPYQGNADSKGSRVPLRLASVHRPAVLLGLVALAATTYAASASASLIALDLFTAGDGLITRDTETGLDWLDLPATVNLSYNDVEADVGGWVSLGFRHATGSQVCGLFSTYAVAPAPCPGVGPVAGPVIELMSFVGITNSGIRIVASTGLFDDGDASNGVGLAGLQWFLGGSMSQS